MLNRRLQHPPRGIITILSLIVTLGPAFQVLTRKPGLKKTIVSSAPSTSAYAAPDRSSRVSESLLAITSVLELVWNTKRFYQLFTSPFPQTIPRPTAGRCNSRS